jgi:hypothetical protein
LQEHKGVAGHAKVTHLHSNVSGGFFEVTETTHAARQEHNQSCLQAWLVATLWLDFSVLLMMSVAPAAVWQDGAMDWPTAHGDCVQHQESFATKRSSWQLLLVCRQEFPCSSQIPQLRRCFDVFGDPAGGLQGQASLLETCSEPNGSLACWGIEGRLSEPPF